jgi:uncharacterized BrkB/YihY/UPF0761 family membrane protein
VNWDPRRFHFALARLVARIVSECGGGAAAFKAAQQRRTPKVIYAVDRHQSAIENHAVSVWFFVSTICFIAAALPLVMPLALVAAVPLALLAIQIPIYITGLPFSNARLNSKFMMLCGAAAAAYSAAQPGWVRFVGWTFLGVIALNAIAWIIVKSCEE